MSLPPVALLREVLRAGLLSAVLWVSWRIVKRFVVPSPLDNVPGPPSQSFVNGNMGQLFARNCWDFVYGLGDEYGPVVKLHGPFGTKQLYVFDPVSLSSIVVKDQHIYEETYEFLQQSHLLLGDGLLATSGERHRRQRKLLNPVFSANHIRQMTPIFYQICYNLRDAVATRVKGGTKEIDMLGWMSRTALELIGQTGLGHSFDPLVRDISDEYANAVKSIIPASFALRLWRPLLQYILKIGTPQFRRRVLEMIPSASVQRAREVSDTLDEHARRILEEKKLAMERGDEAVLHQVGEGKDILSRLLQANLTASKEDQMPDDEILGQITTFVFTGMDTTSNALSRTLLLLAQQPHVQDKLRAEILEAFGSGKEIPYDELVDLPYLDAVCRETMRLHAPVPMLNRRVQKDMVLPVSSPVRGTDGKLMDGIPVPKGTDIWISITGANRNQALWGPDASEWKPERWLAPLPDALSEAHIPGVYSHLMTFLGGSRACIGFKFSQLEMKVVLAVLLSTFSFSLTDKEICWNIGEVQYPTVGYTNIKPEMPLMVNLLR